MSHIAVIIGSTRPNRFSEMPAKWIADRLALRDDMTVETIDLRDHPLPMFAEAASPARTGREYSTPEIEAFATRIDAADGFVFVAPEYNHSYSAVLKNVIDYTFVQWNHKPVSFVSWGNVGGARAVEQLRLVAVELEMAPLRHAVHILPGIMLAVRAAENPFDPAHFESLEPRADALAEDLAWWTKALAAAR